MATAALLRVQLIRQILNGENNMRSTIKIYLLLTIVGGVIATVAFGLRLEAQQKATQQLAHGASSTSPQDIQAIIEDKNRIHQQHLDNMAIQQPRPTEPNPFVGILDAGQVPAAFKPSEFKPLNFWGGDINNVRIGVYAGYRPDNPMQGVIIVFDNPESSAGQDYSVPIAAGPVRIIAEKNGVLTLQAIAGDFEEFTGDDSGQPATMVHTTGGRKYFFDLSSRSFK